MSCLKNIDPYNNAPPPREGGKCGSGGCGGVPSVPEQERQQRLKQQQQQQQQRLPQIPQYNGSSRNNNVIPSTEIMMLRSDLQEAIAYIQRLGGTWPPS